MREQKIPEFGTIERLNFDVGKIVEFIIGDERPFAYTIPKDFLRVVIPFLDYRLKGPQYYLETVVLLAYYKLKDFVKMEQFIASLMEDIDNDFH